MATRINTKFVIILTCILVVLTGGVVFAVLKLTRDAADFVRMGELAMSKAEAAREAGKIDESNRLFKQAAQHFGSAQNKDKSTSVYMYSYMKALNRVTVSNLSLAYDQLDEEYGAALTLYRADSATDEDRGFLYALLHKRLRMQLIVNNKKHPLVLLRSITNSRLSDYADDLVSLKYYVIAQSYFHESENKPEERKKSRDLLAKALKASPKDPWLHLAAARFNAGDASRMFRENGRQINDEIRQAVMRNYNSSKTAVELAQKDNPAALVRATDLLLGIRGYDSKAAAGIIAEKIRTAMLLSKVLSDKAKRDQLLTEELRVAVVKIASIAKGTEKLPFDGRALALKLAQAIVSDRPTDPTAYAILGSTYQQQQKLKESEKTVEKGLTIERPTNGQDYVRDQSARQEMLITLTQVKLDLAMRSGSDKARRTALLKQGDSLVQRLTELSTPRPEARDVDVKMLQGYLNFARGRANIALDHFTAVNDAKEGKDLRTLVMLARCYQRMKLNLKVNETYEQILALQETSPYRLELVKSYLNSANDSSMLDRAESHLDYFQNLYPKNIEAIRLRSRLLVAQGKTPEAIALLQKQDLEKNPTLKSLIAQYQLQSGDRENAVKILRERLAELPKGQRMPLSDVMRLIQVVPDKAAKAAEIKRLESLGLDKEVAKVLTQYLMTGNKTLEGDLVLLSYRETSPGKLAIEKYKLYRQWNKPDLAAKQLAEASRLAPGLPEVVRWRFATALDEERWADAEQAIKDMMLITDQQLPDIAVADGVFMRARLLATRASKLPPGKTRQEQLLEAETAYKGALNNYTDYVDGWVQLGKIQMMRGDAAGARESLQQALNRRSGYIEALELMAQVNAMTNEPVQALRNLEQILRARPANATALNQHTVLARRLKLIDQAIAMRVFVRGRLPRNAANRRVLASLFAEKKQFDLAKAEIAEAVKIEGQNLANIAALSGVLLLSGEKDKAVQAVKEYVSGLDPDKAGWPEMLLLAQTYHAVADWNQADDAFAKAMEKEGDEGMQVLAVWTRLLVQRKEPGRAASLLEQAMKKRPKNTQLMAQTVQLFLSAGQTDKAEAILKQMKASPARSMLQIQVAATRDKTGTQAVQAGRTAVKAFPDNEALRLQLTRLLVAQQRQLSEERRKYDEAYRLISKLVKDKPKSIAARLLLVDVLNVMNRVDDAERELMVVFESSPDNTEANNRLFDIKFGRAQVLARRDTKASQALALEALNIANKLMKDRTDSALLFRRAGQAASMAGLLERATGLYSQAFGLSNEGRDLTLYAATLLDRDKNTEALELLQNPDNATLVSNSVLLRSMRGRALALTGNTSSAIALFQNLLRGSQELAVRLQIARQVLSAFRSNPTQPAKVIEGALGQTLPFQIDGLLATFEIGTKQFSMAAQRLGKYEAKPVENISAQFQFILQLALARQELKEYAASKTTYEKALAIANKHRDKVNAISRMQLMNNLAYLLADHIPGQAEQAVVYARQALKLLPKGAPAQSAALIQDTLGWSLFKANKIDEAIKELEASVSKSAIATNLLHLGRVYLAKGDNTRAKVVLRRAIERAQRENNTTVLKEAEKWLKTAG